jgi:hypothetical protein
MHVPLNIRNVMHLLVWIKNINMISDVQFAFYILFSVKKVLSKDNSVTRNANYVYITNTTVCVVHCWKECIGPRSV